jgi:hypothetical protein
MLCPGFEIVNNHHHKATYQHQGITSATETTGAHRRLFEAVSAECASVARRPEVADGVYGAFDAAVSVCCRACRNFHERALTGLGQQHYCGLAFLPADQASKEGANNRLSTKAYNQ